MTRAFLFTLLLRAPACDAPGVGLDMVRSTCLAAVILGLACSSATPPPGRPPPRPSRQSIIEVRVDPGLLSGCELPAARTRLPYDPAVLEPPRSDVLKDVAHCLARGRLAGRGICVVGHIDPRRPARYVAARGQSSAETLGEYLVFHGVDRAAIEIQASGDGEADAPIVAGVTGHRRVELHLDEAGGCV